MSGDLLAVLLNLILEVCTLNDICFLDGDTGHFINIAFFINQLV